MSARAWGFIACLFDAHDLVYDAPCHWNVCARCGERRVTDREFEWLTRGGKRSA